jgi:hypothetical protein
MFFVNDLLARKAQITNYVILFIVWANCFKKYDYCIKPIKVDWNASSSSACSKES